MEPSWVSSLFAGSSSFTVWEISHQQAGQTMRLVLFRLDVVALPGVGNYQQDIIVKWGIERVA